MIGILDLGMGNLRSVSNALYSLGYDFAVINEPGQTQDISHLVIPGVGAYTKAMRRLEEQNLKQYVLRFVSSGRPLLGICLGMQLLSERGEEGGDTEGLGLIPGKVCKFSDSPQIATPHVGWNSVRQLIDHPIFYKVKQDADFYFVHSYYFDCSAASSIYAVTEYGRDFSSVVGRENVVGVQFHPEKSQVNGMRLLENFCGWNGSC